MSVPRIEPGFGHDVGEPGGLLDAVQRGNSDIIKQLKPSHEVVCFLAACVHGVSRYDRYRDGQRLAVAVMALDEADDARSSRAIQ
jgi:hypothetical protein